MTKWYWMGKHKLDSTCLKEQLKRFPIDHRISVAKRLHETYVAKNSQVLTEIKNNLDII